MVPNILVIAGTALIPFLVAFAWYHPKAFGGDTWAKLANLTDEQAANPVKPLKLILSILFNFFIALGLYGMCVHQSGVFSLVGGDIDVLTSGTAAAFMAEYGDNYLTFKHGALHGGIASVFLALPILGYNMIFERKSGKYLLVNWGFWLISMILMGGVICQWGASVPQ